MEVNGGAFPQPSRGFYNTILKELGRKKNIKSSQFGKKAQMGRSLDNIQCFIFLPDKIRGP